jgi:hypothetical protein
LRNMKKLSEVSMAMSDILKKRGFLKSKPGLLIS